MFVPAVSLMGWVRNYMYMALEKNEAYGKRQAEKLFGK